jgi:hypothetical protein
MRVIGAGRRLLAGAARACTRRLRFARMERRFRGIVRRHRRARWAVIASELARARPGYVLLAGDSHAELLGTPDFGRPVVNGGVGGIRTAEYAADLARLRGVPRAGLAVLFIGTNDTVSLREPGSARRRHAFDADAARVVGWLRAHADAVLVAAIPPVRPAVPGYLDAPATLLYSERLERAASLHGCAYIDPFAALRDGDPARMRAGVETDPGGCHLADYGLLERALAPAVAAALAGRPPC